MRDIFWLKIIINCGNNIIHEITDIVSAQNINTAIDLERSFLEKTLPTWKQIVSITPMN